MSNAILEMIWPARGGGYLAQGSFEGTDPHLTWIPNESTTLLYKFPETEDIPAIDGDYLMRMRVNSDVGPYWMTQTLSNYAYYLGKQVTVLGRVRMPTGIVNTATVSIECNDTEYTSSPNQTGGEWEYLRRSCFVSAGSDHLNIVLKHSAGANWNRISYWDAIALVMGDTYSRVVVSRDHVFPESNPENVMSSAVQLADGDIVGIEDGSVVVEKEYVFRGLTNELYYKLRNFQRYICCGKAYEFNYTDITGETYQARMLSSFENATRIGPNTWNATMKLRLKDKGIA